MNEETAIKEAYRQMYRGMIDKDREVLESVLRSSFVLVHMTGLRQSREVYISSIENGTLNYFSEEPVEVTVTVHGDQAELVGKSRVNAAVFGGGRHTWPLQLDIELVRTDGNWRMTQALASTF